MKLHTRVLLLTCYRKNKLQISAWKIAMVRWKLQRLKHCCRRLYQWVLSADNADDCSTNDRRITACFRRVLCSWSIFWPRNQAQCWGGLGFVVAVVVVALVVVFCLFVCLFFPLPESTSGAVFLAVRTAPVCAQIKVFNNVKLQAGSRKWITSKTLLIKIMHKCINIPLL